MNKVFITFILSFTFLSFVSCEKELKNIYTHYTPENISNDTTLIIDEIKDDDFILPPEYYSNKHIGYFLAGSTYMDGTSPTSLYQDIDYHGCFILQIKPYNRYLKEEKNITIYCGNKEETITFFKWLIKKINNNYEIDDYFTCKTYTFGDYKIYPNGDFVREYTPNNARYIIDIKNIKYFLTLKQLNNEN